MVVWIEAEWTIMGVFGTEEERDAAFTAMTRLEEDLAELRALMDVFDLLPPEDPPPAVLVRAAQRQVGSAALRFYRAWDVLFKKRQEMLD